MKRQFVRMTLGAVLALLVAAPAAQGAVKVVNIDLGLHGDHPLGAVSVGYVGVAAAPDSGTVWNNIEVLDNNAFQGPPGMLPYRRPTYLTLKAWLQQSASMLLARTIREHSAYCRAVPIWEQLQPTLLI